MRGFFIDMASLKKKMNAFKVIKCREQYEKLVLKYKFSILHSIIYLSNIGILYKCNELSLNLTCIYLSCNPPHGAGQN